LENEMKVWLCVLLLCCIPSGLLFGQAVSQISGTVKDSSGAVVPGVEVTATQTDTGIKRTVSTDETGAYILPNLPLGPYRLEAVKEGFRPYAQTGIQLQVSSSPVIPITIDVGAIAEQVQVEADVVQVEQRSASIGDVVETARIMELPLNGRDPIQLITLSGAAVLGSGTGPGDMKTGNQISVAGGAPNGVQYNLDGAPHLNYFSGDGGLLPFPDALQEFKLSTSTQDASTSGHSAATINAVTKSGTNSFHGDAFEFLRNYGMNARDYFATRRDGLKRNQFGGTFGGPIQKDKLFFFVGYQGTVVRQTPISSSTYVPTAQMLAGDFTTVTSAACNNGKAITLKAPFVNNQISPSLLSPAALKVAAHLPTPLNSCGLVQYGVPLSENDVQLPVRVDYQLTEKHSLFARYMLATQNDVVPYKLSGNNLLTTTGSGADDKENALALGDTWVISPAVVNSFRLAGNRIGTLNPGTIAIGAPDVGINMYSYLPHVLYLGVSGAFSIGASSANTTAKHDTSFGLNDDLTWIHGSHQFAFGAALTRDIMRRTGNAYSMGQFQIGATTGLGLADFELGLVSSLRQQSPNPLNYGQNFLSAYARDTWNITPKLTLNYGLNWEPFTGVSFVHGEVYTFSLAGFSAGQRSTVIPTAPPGFAFPGDPGFSGNSGVKSQWAYFDPRVGLAWDPFGDGKTAIRAGAGIGRDFVNGYTLTNEQSALPFGLSVVSSAVSLDNPYAGGDPYPYNFNPKNPFYPSVAQIPCLANTCAPSFLPIPANFKTLEQYSWNLAVQRQVKPSLFISATYLGTHLIHTQSGVELNPAIYVPGNCAAGQYGLTAPGPCTQAGNINQRRVLNLANPQAPPLSTITQYDDGGTQSYNGLLLTTKWRLGQQVNLNANYTWSHCIGMGSGGGALNQAANYLHQGYGQNVYPENRRLDYGTCGREHIANTTLLFQTPRFSNHIANLLGSDWTFSSILVANSGASFGLTTSAAPDPATGFGASGSSQRPNQLLADTASPTRGQPCSNAAFCVNWLNPAAFAAPALGTPGNMGAGSLKGPSFWEWDQALSRQFRIREGQKLEVRAEAFNITNSFHPGNPGTTVGSSTFGIISSDYTAPSPTTAPARVLQLAMKYIF
jgi:hypothetical protein